VFSPKDIVTILTRNAGIAAMKDDQLGTLEVGKFADMVVLDGDPLANAGNLLNVAMVIKNGEIVMGQ
jgi:imidazolonepropionase-like amidohydrolase